MMGMSQSFEKRINVLQTQNYQLEARLMQTESKVRKVSLSFPNFSQYKQKLKSMVSEIQTHRSAKPFGKDAKSVVSPKDLSLSSVTGEKQVLAAH